MPVSCESSFSGNSTLSTSVSDKTFYDVGCIEKVSMYLSDHVAIVIIVSAAIMVFQVCKILLSSLELSYDIIVHIVSHVPGDWSVSFMLSGKICSSGALG